MSEILMIFPYPAPRVWWDVVIAEQAMYYGQRNAHVIAWLRSRLEGN